MTRTEIIAQLDAELGRLERARDFLTAALKDSKKSLMRKVEKRLPEVLASATLPDLPTKRTRRKAAALAVPTAVAAAFVASPEPAKEEPQVKRVPPRRRVERRLADKPGKSTAALSGMVPTGPVAVSADEARKMQERAHERALQQPAMPVSELRSDIPAERSLGSLIQAFERRAGLNGLETP